MFNLMPRAVAHDSNNVEARLKVYFFCLYVSLGGKHKATLFLRRYSIARIAKSLAAACLYLDKDKHITLLRHKVNLLMSAAPIIFADGKTLLHKIARSQHFALITK